MRYDNVPQLECSVEENNWLDIVYVQNKYTKSKDKSLPKANKRPNKFFVVAAIAVVMAGVLLGLAYADSGFTGGIFESVRETFTSGLFAPKQQVLQMPANAQVQSAEGGNIILSGGQAVFNISKGTVKHIDVENGVVIVKMDDVYDIVYSSLTEILVVADQQLDKYALIGRYDQTATVNILKNGVIVNEVMVENYQLIWRT